MFRKVFLLLFLLIFSNVFLFSIEIFSPWDEETITNLLDRNNINRIALVGAVNYPETISNKGLSYLYDSINNSITKFADNKYEIIIRDRAELHKMLGELKFQTDDIIAPESAQSLGRLLGVESIIYLNIYTSRMNVRFINVESGQIIWSEMKSLSTELQEVLFPGITAPVVPKGIERLYSTHPDRQGGYYPIIKYALLALGVLFFIIGFGAITKGKSSEKTFGLLLFVLGLFLLVGGYFL